MKDSLVLSLSITIAICYVAFGVYCALLILILMRLDCV